MSTRRESGMKSHLCASLALLCALGPAGAARAADPVTVDQVDRAFSRSQVTIKAGDTIRFDNDDEFGHQVYVAGPGFSFDTDETDPGGHVDEKFTTPGHYTVKCHIHPKMRMDVDVK